MKKTPTAGKPELLKRINRNIVIKLIMKEKEISRSQIAKVTNLALPSVMRIVDGLVEDGLVIDIGKGDSSGGRRPNLVSLNKEAMYIFGVEIAENVEVILSNLAGEVVSKIVIEQTDDMVPLEILQEIYSTIEEIKKTTHMDNEKIAGVGIGTPGSNYKYVQSVGRTVLKGWEAIDIKSWFEERINHLVLVENVARTRTLGELWFGKGEETKSFIYVFVDRGVGCGIVNSGVIFKGTNGVAGEFGHTIIEFGGKNCYCGKKGCIEMYVSSGALTEEANKFMNHENLRFSELVQFENKVEVEHLLRESGKVLGVGVSNLINIYNPEAVIIGGDVPLLSKVFSQSALENISDNVFNNAAVNTPVYLSSVKKEDQSLGSIALVIDHVFKSVVI